MAEDDDSESDAPIGDLPGRSAAEAGAGIVKAGLTGVPIVGGAAAELFELVMAPSLERRRDEWLRRLGMAVEELRTRLEGFDPRDLEGNEAFVSTVIAASTIAVRTHQAEKLEMLGNAVVNAAMPNAPADYEQMTYLRLVDELTPLHVRVLALLADPGAWFDRHNITRPNIAAGAISSVVQAGIPELSGRTDLTEQVARDLYAQGLTEVASFHGVMSGSGVWAQRATALGRAFLSFVGL